MKGVPFLTGIVIIFAAVAAYAPVAEAKPKDEKVAICHIPPGNPQNAHTVVVGPPAVETHLAHGDTLGPCPGQAAVTDGDTQPGTPGAGKNFVVALRGTAVGVATNVSDIDGDGLNDPALCFNVYMVDPSTNNVIGTAMDCLSNVELVGGSLVITGLVVTPTTPLPVVPIPLASPVGTRLVNTTFFHFSQGDLVQRGNVTMQQVLFPSNSITHITGSFPEQNNLLPGTGSFANATGRVRRAGAVNMSQLLTYNILTLDCLFVIALD